jgi:hypothetical protein
MTESRRITCLLSGGIDSEAIAHMNADAEFKPPPQRRIADEINTSRRGKILGKAPRYDSISSREGRPGNQTYKQ